MKNMYTAYMSESIKPRPLLAEARKALGLTQSDAGLLIGRGLQTIQLFEYGYGAVTANSRGLLRDLCRAYQARAAELDHDTANYHEAVLCPNDRWEMV